MSTFVRRPLPFVSLFLLISLSLTAPSAAARDWGDLTGVWEGHITVSSGELGIRVEFRPGQDTEWTGTVDIAVQGARGLPLDEIMIDAGRLSFRMPKAISEPSFDGALAEDGLSVAGIFTQGGSEFPFEMAWRDDSLIAAEAGLLQTRLQTLREFIDTTRSEWRVPGLSMAVVYHGKTVLQQGFGQRDAQRGLAVTRATLFPIGSASETFTAAAAAAMVDAHRLDWDKPLRGYLPEFQMWDGLVSDRITVRDLLTHRSGLPGHDMLPYNTSLDREDLVERMRYLEPNVDFRTLFQRQDLVYTVVGQLVADLNRSSWEEALQRHLLSPLRMSRTVFTLDKLLTLGDYAKPHRLQDGVPAPIPFRNVKAVGPALGISINAVEIADWLDFFLRKGVTGQAARLLSDRLIDELCTPQITLPPDPTDPERQGRAYAMGWYVETYRGHRRVFTDGTIDGFSSTLSFFPDDDLGVAVLCNLEASPLPEVAALYASDLFLDLAPVDFNGRALAAAAAADKARAEAEIRAEEMRRHKGTNPSHKLEQFAGRYDNPGYGRLTVEVQDKRLRVAYDNLTAELEHLHYDTFRGRFAGPNETFDFHFITNDKGDIAGVEVPFEPEVSDIAFTRLPTEHLENPHFLAKLAGDYDLVGRTIQVELRRDQLVYRAPGQPEHMLVPYRGTEFEIAGLSGYSIEFVLGKNDSVKELLIRQPTGVFSAPRLPGIVPPSR